MSQRGKKLGSNPSGSGSSSTRSSDSESKLKMVNIITGRVLCATPSTLRRDRNAIPFYVPHRKFLETIEFVEEVPEPLTGFGERQRSLCRHGGHGQSFFSVLGSGDGINAGAEIDEESVVTAVLLPHHKLSDVIDQAQLIKLMRSTTDGSFVYMTYACPQSSEHYTPYALKVVQFKEVDKKNFFTMSAHGVLHHTVLDTIYTTLDKWESEYRLYCRLMQIKSFFFFRTWKGFFMWRRVIAFKKYNNAKNYLDQNLFILNPFLRTGLLDIQLMCYKMSDVTFTNVTCIEDFLLFYFIEDQMVKLEQVTTKVENFREVSLEIISNACHGALLAKGFVIDEREGVEAKEKKRKEKGAKTSYIEQANKKKFCERLTCFIMLADYLMYSMLHRLIINSVNELNDTLRKHVKFVPDYEILEGSDLEAIVEDERAEEEPQMPLFIVDLIMKPDELKLNPPQTICEFIFNKLVDLWKRNTKSIESFVGDSYYRSFTNPIINGKEEDRICGFGTSLDFYLKNDEKLAREEDRIFDFFIFNYNAAEEYIQRFDFIREFFAEDMAVEEESIKEERDLEKFRQMCERYNNEVEIVNALMDSQKIGLLNIKFAMFKRCTLPQPERLIECLQVVLPDIGKTKIDKLQEDSDEAEAFLLEKPVETIQYVKYLEYLEKATGMMDDMEAELDYCKELYDIMEEFKIPVNSDDMNNYLGISVTMGTLRNLADKKLEEMGLTVKSFTECMNKDISLLISEVGVIKDECMQPWLYDIDSNVTEVTEFLNDLHDRLLDCHRRAQEFKNHQKQFRMDVTRFDMLDEVMSDVKLRMLLWESVETWAATVDSWYHSEFNELNVEDMNMFTAKNIKNVTQLEKGLPKNLIVPRLRDDVELMKDKLPIIAYLRNQSLKQRHWLKIENVLNYKFKADDVLSLDMLENLKVFSYPNELMEISAQASSEAGLEALLKKVEENWKTLEFPVIHHKDQKDIFILGSLEEVQAILDESNINIATIASSRHVGPIKPRVDEWSRMLDIFSNTMDEWMTCQQTWVYLEVIFSAPDIQRQLPAESKLFLIVDKSWKEIMRRTAKMPLAMETCLFPGLLETFKKNNALLEQIMKCLEYYLETKRAAFPRFYFLSNDELLDILAQTRNPHAVQPHLRKCFDAISKLEFAVKEADPDEEEGKKGKAPTVVLTTDIVAMISPEGERVALGKGLKARGNVEDWLSKVEESMFLSLRRHMKNGLNDFANKLRTQWVLCHNNQVVLAVSQIMWAKGVHEILDAPGDKKVGLQKYEQKCINDLNDLAALVSTNLTSVARKILIALITIDVHARDTINSMVQSKANLHSNSFDWLKVLRYYWEEKIDDCVAKMSSAYYVYGYEYLGASGVLVITPLTDRCYLCLMGALQFDLGGAPAGPAGTGKTETTKDLAKALAIQCVVFNCSEGLDYKMMGRFFSGLAQSGAWCCFDEFNRIDIEVLSVIAQQIITIRNAKAAKLTRFMFEGREIKLMNRCAAFITMNPGYAGRTELPDNLKALFRPISMMVPDYALIAEVILYSEGFKSSKILSKKMVQMYKLCSEQLSQQDHYDFGMRAVKSVLVMAGALKRSKPDRTEDVVLICALRDSNLPKFLSDDAQLFQGILGDLFPGVELPVEDYGSLQKAIEVCMIINNLQPEECMTKKVIQLYETMIVRWGVMLVGPTGGGKSTVLKTLERALVKMYEEEFVGPYYHPVHSYIMNPKAVTAGELYGEVNPFTLEWRDGLMGIMMRTAVQDVTEDHQWIICDGPVDAVWIENLNTVLDDNKMLCLANSERIKLTPYVHMVFEVQDLSQASPATVSRCGMVYIDSDEIRWFPYAKSWVCSIDDRYLNAEMKEFMLELFTIAIDRVFTFMKKQCDFAIFQVEISKVAMTCNLIQSIMELPGAMDKIGEKAKVRTFLCQVFIFSFLWGLGGNLTEYSREKLEVFVRDQFDEYPDARLPPGADLWSVYVNVQSHRLESWNEIMPKFIYNSEVPYFEILVPTIDTVRFGHIMELLIYRNYPVLLTGDTGVGKSVVAKDVLNRLVSTNKFVPVTLNFSAQTSSIRTQEILELKLEKKKKTLLGAPVGKRVVVFVDDVNMPKLETYGAQPPIELLRQFLDYGGLYDRDKLFWKDIKDVVITTACAPPGGGRNPLTPRFVRHFGMLLIPSPNELSLKGIFKAIIKGFLFNFSNAVRDLGDYLVNAAVEIYDRISTDLLPTPTKSHYIFNLRDLSKCVQGILQADSGTLREEIVMLRLFYHECLRVFHDRLINVQDKSYFYYLMKEICNRHFGTAVLELPDEAIITQPPILLFGDFMQFGASKEDRIYEEITRLEKLRSILQDYLDDFNIVSSKNMRLIFFMDAIEHCIRIARVLRAERGNALLVGVGGMGKQSLTRLSSHLNIYRCFQIELTRNYDRSFFFEDLRKMCFYSGAQNNHAVFLFTDTQIVQEEFLEDINNLLNSGEVPNLFESDELEKAIIATRDAAKESGISPNNRDGIYDFFVSRVRNKLHLVICMSPVGDAFRRRCRMFPSLVNCCTIDWFEKWPQEALLSVAQDALKEVADDKTSLSLSSICVTIHESVELMTKRYYDEMKRYYYTTPSSYLELLKLYKIMLTNKKDKVTFMRDRIANGLRKLYETNSVIDDMKLTLIALEPELAKKSIAVEELMVYLAKEQKQADKVRFVVKGDEEVAKEKAEVTQALADDAQKDLDAALPALEAASKALEALNKNDINELKVFQKPPKLVQFVMEAICILLGSKILATIKALKYIPNISNEDVINKESVIQLYLGTDWAAAKVVLADTNFLKKLQEYDKNHITEIMLRKLKPYIDSPEFVPDKVASVSKACKSMCMWARAIDSYAKIFKVVEPKRKKLDEAERELNVVMATLKEKQRQLADVEAVIAGLEAKFDATVAEKQALEDNIELTSNRLNRAGRLNVALGDEQTRWEQSVKKFGIELINLLGDVLIAAACVAYMGAFTNNYRKELIGLWEGRCKEFSIPSSESFSLITVLADPYDIRTWNSYGLPRDQVSTENGILVTQAGRWPLMIDPQEQANRWIKQMEAQHDLRIVKLTDGNFLRVLEMAIRLGMPVLLEEVGETLDPTLGPILMKQTYVSGGRLLIRLGDTDVDYDVNFRFYVTTKLANPHYLPEICIQVTIVNFTVTPSGLEDQLLADVVRLERPDLESLRTELVIKINDDKTQLKNIEDKILYMLYNASGNILDDEDLIEALNESKETSAIIAARLIETEATEEKISIAREKYRSVAERGSVLYFVVAQLSEIDPMYQYSLKYFNQVFNMVIDTSEKNDNLEIRLQILYDEITLAVYTNVSRGLFERHKLVFSFMLCVAIFKQAGKIREEQWNYLLRGPIGVKIELPPKPDYPTLTDAMWLAVNSLPLITPSFAGIMKDAIAIIPIKIGSFDHEIRVVRTSEVKQHKKWNDIIDDFDKLLLLKTLQEEKLVFAITEYVKTKLGQPFIESPQVSLQVLYQDTSNTTPLIFVLSTGSDPFSAFQRFASDMGFKDRIQSISLGQGQGPVAEKLIQIGIDQGDWVFLQNCHLATSWMLSMERIVLKIASDASKIHKDFRLYMSSMPCKSFPVSVLQNSLKVTNEPPKGLRANLKRAYTDMLDDFIEDHPLEQKWKTMVFGICMFHAVVQERKKFGPLGWNIVYEFNDSDREFAFNTLRLFCSEGYIPWDALEYLTGEITYGGRVTDYWDLRCLKTILKIFFSPQTLEKKYVYSQSGVYYCPHFSKIQEYRDFIDQLPIMEAPEIFGMHENANIAYQIKETQTVILTILYSQPKASGGADAASTDDIVYDLADTIIEALVTKITDDDCNVYLFKRDDKGRLPSLTTVLTQEIDRYNILLKLIHNSLHNIRKAIKGLVVMSEALEEVFTAFLNNEVPKMWSKKAYNSLKSLGSWVRDIVLRLDFIMMWLRSGHPSSYWISGFYFPQGFLTGTLQTHARKYNLPIDQLKFDFQIYPVYIDQEEVKKQHDELRKDTADIYRPIEEPEDGVIIHGLFVDAGCWNIKTMLLVDAKPGETNPPLPALYMIPTTELPAEDTRYITPLYKTSIRAGVLSTTGHSTNFVIGVLLPSNYDQSYWILKGTALLTQVTD